MVELVCDAAVHAATLLPRFSEPFYEAGNLSGAEADDTTSGPIAAVEEKLLCKSPSRTPTKLE